MNILFKGGELSSQFRWFTTAKNERQFLKFFVLIVGLWLRRYSTNAKRYPPEKVFRNPEFSFQTGREILF